MSLDALSVTLTSSCNFTATKNVSGFQNGIVNANNVTKAHVFTKSTPNASPLGADEFYSQLLSIAASGTATIDLSNFTDAAGVAACTLVGGRVKSWRFHLLGAAETSPDGSVAGTACSGVSIGNGSTPFPFNLSSGTTTKTINNGAVEQYGDGSAAGFVVDSTHKIILITNLDSVNAAKLLVEITGCTS